MHDPAPVLENNTRKLLWDFDIHTDYLISAKRQDLEIVNKKKDKPPNCRLYRLGRLQSKYQRKRKGRTVLRPCQRTKQAMKHENDSDPNCNWCAQNDPQMLGKGAGRVGNRRTGRDHLLYSIVKISQNTEKSPGDLKRFAVSQTSMKYH